MILYIPAASATVPSFLRSAGASVHVVPHCSHERAVSLCRALDIGVIPYSALGPTYGSPTQVFEYMAAGACVVAPHLGQLRDVLGGGAGLTYRPGSMADMIEAIQRMISDPEQRRVVAKTAREKVMREYTWVNNARRVVQFCVSVSGPMG